MNVEALFALFVSAICGRLFKGLDENAKRVGALEQRLVAIESMIAERALLKSRSD